ncbi:hypothetical protein J6590_039053 [Homalodisca vitripennis]|nr:hypothetical protein J6590_039053 [Homalodisca vitripennis]
MAVWDGSHPSEGAGGALPEMCTNGNQGPHVLEHEPFGYQGKTSSPLIRFSKGSKGLVCNIKSKGGINWSVRKKRNDFLSTDPSRASGRCGGTWARPDPTTPALCASSPKQFPELSPADRPGRAANNRPGPVNST